MRWPGKIKAGSILNGIVSHQDMLPTLLAAAGDTERQPEAPGQLKLGDRPLIVLWDTKPQLSLASEKEQKRKHYISVG